MLLGSKKRLIAIILTGVVIVGGVLLATRPDWAKRWLANRFAARADALFKSGNHEAGRLAALKALQFDPNCFRAVELMVPEISQDPSSAVFIRARLADLKPGDLSNLQSLALLGIMSGYFNVAEKAISDLERGNFSAAGILELRSRLYAAQGDFNAAGEVAKQLLEKDPNNQVGKLIRAVALINQDPPEAWGNAEAELSQLTTIEPLALEAQRALRHAALKRKDYAAASEWSRRVVANPAARFDDRLANADLVYASEPGRLAEIVSDLTEKAGSDPESLALIAVWLSKIGKPAQIGPWVDECKALKSQPILAQMLKADALAEQKAWAELSAFLAPLKWEQNEYYRLALQARALREQQQSYAEAWKAATEAALKTPSAASKLAEAMTRWPGWEDQREEFLWLAEQKDPMNLRWTLAALSARYQVSKNTRGLLRVSEELFRAYPSNEPIQNNLAFYSLLLNSFSERAMRISETLYGAHPTEPEIASTYSLALMRKTNFKKALEVLSKLPPNQLARNDLAPYYAAALAGTGQLEKAKAVARNVDLSKLLPEERALLEFQ